jgi:hypothetical protein
MKKLFLKSSGIFLLIMLFFTSCSAQNWGKVKGDGNVITEKRSVGDFDELGVSGSFDIFLVHGKEGELTIKIEENLLPYLVMEVDNGKLKIRWKTGTSINTRRGVEITVAFESIQAIGLSGSGDIVGKDIIKSDTFEVAVSGSGDMDLELDVQKMEAAVSGSGDMDLKGTATNFEAAVAGSGDIDGINLKTEKAAVRVSGSGGITITVLNELDAKVSGSGSVRYKGSPAKEDVKVSGSGTVSTY